VFARTFGRSRIELVRGDLTTVAVDAIVNAANSSLLGGGGVDGAIHRAGGPAILEECRQIRARLGSLPAGQAVLTTAGELPSRHVIHTVGPVWQDGTHREAETLASCYRSCLSLAASHGLSTIAFPSISTGIFGYPVDRASEVALTTVVHALREGAPLALVRWVLFSDSDLATYERALAAIAD
jgi:O-acetyl-ADP-ribose deacetylase (regulator of RNase III)